LFATGFTCLLDEAVYLSQSGGARPRVRGSVGAELSILIFEGTGRELVPTAVFCGAEVCAGALTPPLSEMRAIFGSFGFLGLRRTFVRKILRHNWRPPSHMAGILRHVKRKPVLS
jgi:hypothetical protein